MIEVTIENLATESETSLGEEIHSPPDSTDPRPGTRDTARDTTGLTRQTDSEPDLGHVTATPRQHNQSTTSSIKSSFIPFLCLWRGELLLAVGTGTEEGRGKLGKITEGDLL